MPYKKGSLKGQLTTAEIRKLISAHNKLSKITIPPRSTRDTIMKIISKAGFRVNHGEQKLEQTKATKKDISLEKAKETTKRIPKTEEQKKKATERKQEKQVQKEKELKLAKKEGVKEFKKKKAEAQKKKPEPKKKTTMGTQTDEKPKPKKKRTKQEIADDRFDNFIVPEINERVVALLRDWLKNKDDQLYKKIKTFKMWKVPPVKDEATGAILKEGKKNPKPEYYKEKDKLLKELKKRFTEIYKKNNFSTRGSAFNNGYNDLVDGVLKGFGSKLFKIEPDEKLQKKMKERRKKEKGNDKEKGEAVKKPDEKKVGRPVGSKTILNFSKFKSSDLKELLKMMVTEEGLKFMKTDIPSIRRFLKRLVEGDDFTLKKEIPGKERFKLPESSSVKQFYRYSYLKDPSNPSNSGSIYKVAAPSLAGKNKKYFIDIIEKFISSKKPK